MTTLEQRLAALKEYVAECDICTTIDLSDDENNQEIICWLTLLQDQAARIRELEGQLVENEILKPAIEWVDAVGATITPAQGGE